MKWRVTQKMVECGVLIHFQECDESVHQGVEFFRECHELLNFGRSNCERRLPLVSIHQKTQSIVVALKIVHDKEDKVRRKRAGENFFQKVTR
jgi:hypothetical protein